MKNSLTILFSFLFTNVFSQNINFRIDTIQLAEKEVDSYVFFLKAEHNNNKFLRKYLYFSKNEVYPLFMENVDTTLHYMKYKNEFKMFIDESGSYIQINLNPNTKTENLIIRKLIFYKNLANTHYKCNRVYYDDRKRKLKVIKSKISEYDEIAQTQLSEYTVNINGKNYTCNLTEQESTGMRSSIGVYTNPKLSKERQQKFMRHHRFKEYCSVTKKLKTGIIQL